MRTRLATTLALLLTAALLAPQAATAKTTATATATAAAEPTITDGTVTNPNDGTVIAYTLFKPPSASRNRKVPLVFHSHGWGGARSTSGFGEYMQAGLGVLSFDQRGHGESTGEANVQDPDLEAEDVQALVDFVAKLDWVAHDRDRRGRAIANDPVIGAIGGSYGGGYQTISALDETAETGRTRFNALAPEITWYDLPQSLAPNGVTRTAWNVLLYAVGAANVPTFIHEAFAWGATTGQWPDGTILGTPAPGVPNLDAVFHEHSPVAFVERGVRINVPVLFRQGISDNLFNLNQGLDIFTKALTPLARKHSYFVGYNGGHALPNVMPIGSAAGDDACSPGGFTKLTIAFFKRVFAKKPTTGLMPAKYNLTTADGASCLRMNSFARGTTVPVEGPAGDVIATSALGAPLHLEVARGPITVSGVPRLTGTRTALGVDARAFLGLSVGTSPADATVVTNNLMPMRAALPVTDEEFTLDLTGVSVVVPEGHSLFLTLTPVSDLFFGHGSKVPAGWMLSGLQLRLPSPGK